MILCIFGTRPEEIKMYPFSKYKRFKFLLVNQSKDLHQGLIKPDYTCEEWELRWQIEKISPKAIMVQGDTRTAFYGALYAFEASIPIIHLEAGLRTFDLECPFPEEGYRQMIDCISKIKLCSTKQASVNCGGTFIGQTSIDTLVEYSGVVKNKGYWICTIHRQEANLKKIIPTIKKIPGKKIVIAHPNKIGQGLKYSFKTLKPIPYKEFIKLLVESKGVITDSGGLVEEALALGKEVIQLREKTERPLTDEYKRGATKKAIKLLDSLKLK